MAVEQTRRAEGKEATEGNLGFPLFVYRSAAAGDASRRPLGFIAALRETLVSLCIVHPAMLPRQRIVK